MTIKNTTKKAQRPAEIFKLIAKIGNKEKRNLLRGYCSKSYVSAIDAESIRKDCSSNDSMVIGAILKGPHGLIENNESNHKKKSDDIYRLTSFPPLKWRSELCYTLGYINSHHENAIKLINNIRSLIFIELMSSLDALKALKELSNEHGASNFLSFKLAYLRSSRDLTTAEIDVVNEIEDDISHRESPGFHFSALENISSRISLFLVARRRVSGLVGRVEADMRKAISLSNFAPTPLDYDDLSGYLLRATETSLIDAIYSLLVVLNLPDFFLAHEEIKKRLNTEICDQILDLISFASSKKITTNLITKHYHDNNIDSYPSLEIYRVSAAFLERENIAKFRNKLDKVIAARLLAEIVDGKISEISEPFDDKKQLLSLDGSEIDGSISVYLDPFYRTYLFLRFLGNRSNLLRLTKDEIRFVFENTVGLEALLTEEEMRTMYTTAPPEAKSLVGVLALALYRKKSVDPDVDFEFRTDLVSHVKSEHEGDIVKFIEYLLSDSPQVANYIVGSLDEVTLEKLYSLIKNVSQASSVRSEILRAVGHKLNRIEYFIEADSITTRTKVAKLQQYFDSSRMYVDSVAMKKWLDTNPTVSTEQYRSLYPQLEAEISSLSGGNDSDKGILIIRLNNQNEYLVTQIAQDAFEQFCLNPEFGIQSYLGRRIRHNTLDGVTTDSIDSVLTNPQYTAVMTNASMRNTVSAWMESYKGIINRLKKDYLQFKSNSSLFRSTLDLEDSVTKENLRSLVTTLQTSGGRELMNELVIAYCWNQIGPQLENAARFIRTTLLREANASIDKYFSGYYGVLENKMKAELHEAVNDIFKKVADWFQVPQTGYISASVRELCEIISNDLNRTLPLIYTGDSVETKYTGISVHRLYDCVAVLLQNAVKHGAPDAPIEVIVNSKSIGSSSGLESVTVDIISSTPEDIFHETEYRILNAVNSIESSTDMVTEGYTGIKKIKFITRTSEGFHTLRCSSYAADSKISLGFSIRGELAAQKNENEQQV